MTLAFESCTLHPAMQPESDAPLSDGCGQGQVLSPAFGHSGAGAPESPQLAATPFVAAPPGAIELTPASGPGGLNPLSAVFRGRSRDVCLAVADFKAALEEWVSKHPEDYAGLALLGELNVRIGLNGPARELLYRASLLKPPTWEAYQRTSLLLRRAEAELTHEVVRIPGAPPPQWMRRAASALFERIHSAVTRVRTSRRAVVA